MISPIFQTATDLFDQENAKDPHFDEVSNQKVPRELLYAQRLTEWVIKLEPHASETLKLAARCQHLCRWEIPRERYEMNRTGYLKWRTELKKFHAQKSGEILQKAGYDTDLIRKVQDLNLKKNFPSDPESQTLEDALCLVFLEFQFEDLASRYPEEKIVEILQKTWKKMSPKGRNHALKLSYSPTQQLIIQKAGLK